MKNEYLPTCAARTHTGNVRAVNEDRWAISTDHAAQKGGLYVVADGVGGHMAGGVAAELAIHTIVDAFEAIDNTAQAHEIDGLVQQLTNWIALAQNAIVTAQKQKSEYAIMGTTVVVAILFKSKLIVANVGDSRCYLLHHSVLQQLSVDHSWVAEQLRNGVISAKEAKSSLNRNILARALGSPDNATPDISIYDWHDGDRILLCSDGLWGMLKEQQIATLLPKGNPDQAAEALLNAALVAGGEDNITVMVVGDLPNLSTHQQTATLVSENKPDSGNISSVNAHPRKSITHGLNKAPQRLIYFIGTFILLCFSLSAALWGGNFIKNVGEGGILGQIFGANPFIAPILGTPSELAKNGTVVVIPGDNWAKISPIPTTPLPLILPTLTQTPDKPTATATVTPTLATRISTPAPVATSTLTLTTNTTTTATPIVAILATITPSGGATPRPTLTSTPPVAATPLSSPTVSAASSQILAGARLCQASAVLDGSCFKNSTLTREFTIQDNEVYLYWQSPLPKGTLLKVQWLRNGKQLGTIDSCVLDDIPCKNFDTTANYVRLRIKDIQGDKPGIYGYKIYLSDRLVIEGDFVIR